MRRFETEYNHARPLYFEIYSDHQNVGVSELESALSLFHIGRHRMRHHHRQGKLSINGTLNQTTRLLQGLAYLALFPSSSLK